MSTFVKSHNRFPAVAGRFYPDNASELDLELDKLFDQAAPRTMNGVRALISPHAGIVFSGKIAASAFNQIDPTTNYQRVFVLASSHHESFEGASVYCDGDFVMPGGTVEVDQAFGRHLIEQHPRLFNASRSPHMQEHSIELQLPFLQKVPGNGFKLVPIVLGTHQPEVCRKIASALKSELKSGQLFVISSDFSHYPASDDARRVDAETEEAILSNEPEQLLRVLKDHRREGVPGLQTSLCGWTSVLTLMYMTCGEKRFQYRPVDRSNSGDTQYYGNPRQVVGYRAIALTAISETEEQQVFTLTDEEKHVLLREARHSIAQMLGAPDRPESFNSHRSPNKLPGLLAPCGAFVSLHNEGRLRGCYGRMISNDPLVDTVREMTIWAASRDHRFSPVSGAELADIDIEISVLSPMERIEDIGLIQLGIHGIYMRKGHYSGVFLPQVATQTGWTLDEFLGHCARDKAGIGWEGWKEAELYRFTALIFSER